MPAAENPALFRARLEERILATLIDRRHDEGIKAVVEGLDPKLFQSPPHARIAEKAIDEYRLHACFYREGLKSRVGDEDKPLVDRLFVERERLLLPDKADLLALLAGRQVLSAVELNPASEGFRVPLSEFATEPREWLWPRRIELGQLTLVGGEAGSGKSLVACDLAARTTSASPWPDGAAATTSGSVLLVATGADVSGLMRPRLEAAGADVGRVQVLPLDPLALAHSPRDRGFPFKGIVKAIEAATEAIGDCRLVVIDPLPLTVGRVATTVGGDPAARLELLAALARRQQVAVLGVVSAVHEDGRRNNLLEALKLATGTCAAAAWQVVRHPQQKQLRWFLPAKTTRSSDLEGLAFTVVEASTGERVHWQEQPVPGVELAATPRDDAARWLRQVLAEGRLTSKDVLELGQRNGYTPMMLHRAKPAAGVTVEREGFGPGAAWHWVLAGNGWQHAKTA